MNASLNREHLRKADGSDSRRFPGAFQGRRVYVPGGHIGKQSPGAVQTDRPHGGQVVLPPRGLEGHGWGRGPRHGHVSCQRTSLLHLLYVDKAPLSTSIFWIHLNILNLGLLFFILILFSFHFFTLYKILFLYYIFIFIVTCS